MRAPLTILILLGLAACGDAKDAAPEGVDVAGKQAEESDFWQGRFAASPELCEHGAWDIRERRVVTGGETSCEIDHVARAAGQVTLELSCVAEGMAGSERWTLMQRGDDALGVRRQTATETTNVDLARC